MSAETTPRGPLTFSVDVAADPAKAFDAFTAGMGSWWPTRGQDGSTHDLGEVLVWEPPHRLVYTWHHPTPETTGKTEVEVLFEAAEGGTTVSLEHRGWERLGAAADQRSSYQAGWPGVLAAYAAGTVDIRWHRLFGRTLNQEVWRLLGREARTPAEDVRMVHAAHASQAHWQVAGEAVHRARGEWLCSHVYAVLGRGEPAQWHARLSARTCTEGPVEDFDLAYAEEGLARAAAAAGDLDTARHHLELARAAAEKVGDAEDRELVLADLAAGPWYGAVS